MWSCPCSSFSLLKDQLPSDGCVRRTPDEVKEKPGSFHRPRSCPAACSVTSPITLPKLHALWAASCSTSCFGVFWINKMAAYPVSQQGRQCSGRSPMCVLEPVFEHLCVVLERAMNNDIVWGEKTLQGLWNEEKLNSEAFSSFAERAQNLLDHRHPHISCGGMQDMETGFVQN